MRYSGRSLESGVHPAFNPQRRRCSPVPTGGSWGPTKRKDARLRGEERPRGRSGNKDWNPITRALLSSEARRKAEPASFEARPQKPVVGLDTNFQTVISAWDKLPSTLKQPSSQSFLQAVEIDHSVSLHFEATQ